MPLGLLLWAQFRFVPFHSETVTWSQWGAVVMDATMLALFWPRISSDQTSLDWFKMYWLRFWDWLSWRWRWVFRSIRWWLAPAGAAPARLVEPPAEPGGHRFAPALNLLSWAGLAVLLSLFIAILPDEGWWLDLDEDVLAQNDLSPKVINALRDGDAVARNQALSQVLGIRLQGRDLRYARLNQSLLPKADLRGADLEGAKLFEAELQGADLSGAELPGADLFGAQLQGADLRGAQLRGAHLQGADLSGAELPGADLREAFTGGASFESANLDLADLRGLNKSLTQQKYRLLRQMLSRQIRDTERRDIVLKRLKAAIGQGGNLQGVGSAARCLGDDPMPPLECREVECLTVERLAQYRAALVNYLADLACSAPEVGLALARRATGGQERDLGTALLKPDCPVVKDLHREVREELERLRGR
ncbi:MAG: pentapeptide repeat-containing protein [Gammaproteobacteria bacterium]